MAEGVSAVDRPPVLVTGLNGLVGSKLGELFAKRYSFESLDVSDPVRPVDITNADQVARVIAESQATHIVHFAAYTDVTGAWNQRGDTDGLAYRVNVLGTQNVVKAAQSTGKHLIHISTAYVFDGEKKEPYTETDLINPIEWYGHTKALAEEAVQNSDATWTILRIDQPFRSDTHARPDIVRRIVQSLRDGTLYPQFTNHYFGPTFIDDFAKVIEWVIRTSTAGLFHASSGESWSDYDFAKLVQERFQLAGEIKKGDVLEYLKTSQRPYQKNTALNVSKLKREIDSTLISISQALSSVHI